MLSLKLVFLNLPYIKLSGTKEQQPDLNFCVCEEKSILYNKITVSPKNVVSKFGFKYYIGLMFSYSYNNVTHTDQWIM